MNFISQVVSSLIKPKLTRMAMTSKNVMQNCEQKYAFNSKTLKTLFTDDFCYKGNIPNIILVKDSKTGLPAPLKVDLIRQDGIENCHFADSKNNIVARKLYFLTTNASKKYEILPGYMSNDSNGSLAGVGIRLDQLQIERALQKKIETIPLCSLPKSLIFHLKMGFLPSEEEKLLRVKSYKDVLKYKEIYEKEFPQLKQYSLLPIVVQKNLSFYIDRNKTHAVTILRKLEQELQNGRDKCLADLCGISGIAMELSGKALEHWKTLIAKQPILQNLKVKEIQKHSKN